LPDAPQGSYLVKLPPDDHHQRAHPVLMLIHSDREAPEVFLKRWAPLTDVHGFIVIAPLWRNNFKNAYAASDAEHIYFLNCLKDLKRRFQVDTDRVFLFGWANGAQIAWDVGLAHPDQFAGLLPMCGVPNAFSKNYSLNAQNLGLYIVDGDKSGNGPVVTRDMFKDWIRFNYNAYYLEYKGRANELYLGEFEPMMDWMSRKKRQYPMKQLGSFSNTNSVAEEFRTHRQSDNRFYWLSTDELNDNNKQDAFNWVANRSAAKLQATIGVSNSGDTKGNARIETIVSVRANGVKQCTVWLAPSMIDFSKPVQLRVNNRAIRGPQTMTPSIPIMLGEYHQTVDRQRLYYARIDAKL
jgi:pimeloyl-ACP methyl ester carboxylesterase